MLPLYITQRSAPDLLGITGRRFREIVVRHGIPHARDGRLYLVRLEEFERAMERLRTSVEVIDDAPQSVDSMLAELGRGRAA